MAGAERAGVAQPSFLMSDISVRFFCRNPRWLRRLLDSVECPTSMIHPYYFNPLVPVPKSKRSVQVWTLADVERMILFLSSVDQIRYDQMVVALQLVLWTAKGYGLYV